VHQITSPVLWTDSINRFVIDGFQIFIEVGPNKVLSKLMRDINREVKAINVENMDTLEKCKRFLEENV
jgi:[acyl-carrier-protein] S-malonyltransferase